MDFTLRPGTPDDAQACGVICYEAFTHISQQHNFPPDFPAPEVAISMLQMVLSHPGVYSVVAEQEGRIVGSNFLWEGGPVSGVGPITVDCGVQNSTLGRRLMENVLERAQQQGCPSVRLVQSAYHNRSLALYTKLGFDAQEPLSNLNGPPLNISIPGYAVRAAQHSDVEACNRVCERVHGFHRGAELQAAIEQGSATVVEHDNRITDTRRRRAISATRSAKATKTSRRCWAPPNRSWGRDFCCRPAMPTCCAGACNTACASCSR
jgi:predicted N-acetyltransferase YhbS